MDAKTFKYYAETAFERLLPDERQEVTDLLMQDFRYAKYWRDEMYRGTFTLGFVPRAILAFLREKGKARRCEIHRHLKELGWEGFTFSAKPLEKLLVFGLVARTDDGTYEITPVGKQINLFAARYPIEFVDTKWLEHFLNHTW